MIAVGFSQWNNQRAYSGFSLKSLADIWLKPDFSNSNTVG
jgi:hypothetical protein